MSAIAPDPVREAWPSTEPAAPLARFVFVIDPAGREMAPEAVSAPVDTLVGVIAPRESVTVPDVVTGLPETPMPLLPETDTDVTVPLPVPAPRLALAAAAFVAPVPPLAMANVPAMVIVPEVVTGPPEKVRPVVPPDTSTDVTVPPPPVAVMVRVPEPGVKETPDPATRFIMPGKLAKSSGIAPY